MTQRYCDLDLATGADDGTSWSDAFQTWASMTAGMSNGDTVYVKGSETYTSGDWNVGLTAGAETGGIRVIGVKSATTAEPPTASDHIASGDTYPLLDNTTAASKMYFSGAVFWHGIHLKTTNHIYGTGAIRSAELNECKLECDQFGSSMYGYAVTNTQLTEVGGTGAGSYALPSPPGDVMAGQPVAGTPTDIVGSSNTGVNGQWVGLDLSNATAAVCDSFVRLGGRQPFVGCRLPSGLPLVTSFGSGRLFYTNYVEAIDCHTAGSGKTSAITNYQKESPFGEILTDTGTYRTAGADDGSLGNYSLSMDLTANYGMGSSRRGLNSPWLRGWVEGDGSTAFTVKVHIINDASTDYDVDEVWAEMFYPSASGSGQMDYQTLQLVDPLDGTPAVHTSVADTEWTRGGGETNAQSIDFAAITPDMPGHVMVRVWACVNSATPPIIFLCPKLDIS